VGSCGRACSEAATSGPRIVRSWRVVSSSPGDERFRRATDILLLVPAFVGLAILVAAYPPGHFERAVGALLRAIPSWLDPAGAFLYDLLVAAAIALVVTVAAAVAALGRDGVASLLPYLQLAALENRLRQETREAGIDVDALRKQAAVLVGEEEPTVVPLRRVTWRSLLETALLLLAALEIEAERPREVE